MSASKQQRLRPGELDGQVLAYMRKHKSDGPLTASAIRKGIERSAGAISNCLARLAKERKVRQAKKRPRALRPQGTEAEMTSQSRLPFFEGRGAGHREVRGVRTCGRLDTCLGPRETADAPRGSL